MVGARPGEMSSRERVLAAVQGLPIDRVPVMTWLNPHAGCRLMAEFQPATDEQRNAACRAMWEDFSQKRGSLPEDLRAFLPILQTGFVNREYALDLGSDLVSVGIPIDDLGEKVSGEGEPLRIRDTFGALRGMGSIYLEVIEPAVKMWKEFTFPHLKKHIEAVHEAGALAMLHSCGYQMPFLEYYVEAELDILQSLQPKAGNDFATAYQQFGDRLCFATGLDVQQGEMMTPEEFRQDILRAYRIGGRKGRHILGCTHMLQYSMPAENVEVMLRTVREIQAGMHDIESGASPPQQEG